MSLVVKDFIDAGVHYGHRASRWNPKMKPYIYGKRNLIHIIDLKETVRGLLRASKYFNRVAAANGLIPQQAEPLLGRALSYLALGKAKEAAADLDEAVQDDPQNAQAWITRGLAYERLGDKAKAAGSYGRAINLRPKDETARSAFARVGGRPGQSYETF